MSHYRKTPLETNFRVHWRLSKDLLPKRHTTEKPYSLVPDDHQIIMNLQYHSTTGDRSGIHMQKYLTSCYRKQQGYGE